MRHSSIALLTAASLSLVAVDDRACSSCGCTLNTDLGSQGALSGSGWRVGLRYDLVDQDQLRSGDQAVGNPPLPTGQEIEQRTRNAYTTVGIAYGFNRSWGIDVQIPWLDRFHTTYAPGDTALSTSDSKSLSDVRVLARYSGFSPDLSTGILFGFKLPTGPRDTVFTSGPQAGEPLDQSLQPGSGTTDAILSIYHFGDLNVRSGWFVQAQYQHALAAHAGFAQGDSLNLNFGLRYYWNDSITPQLQFNAQVRSHDTSDDPAAHDNSGGRLLYISPGVTFNVGDRWHGHLFLQLPVYQQVYGLQLAPTRIVSAGMSYSF
jgi:hypothetical protein